MTNASTRFTDQSNWMENLPEEITSLPLKSLAIPGSHLSGSFEIDMSMPVASDQPTLLKQVVNSVCYAKDVLGRWRKNQNLSISMQMKHGVRYFDIQAAYVESEDDFFFANGLYGPRISQILGQINSFLNFHPKEIVLIYFSCYHDFTSNLHIRFSNLINSMFQGKMFAQTNGINATIQTIWSQGKQVIIIYDKEVIKGKLYEFWADDCIHAPNPDTNDITLLKALLTQRFNNLKANRFNVLQAILTPTVGSILYGIGSTLEESLVRKGNEMVCEWLQETYDEHKSGMTIVLLDFVEIGDCIPVILKFNQVSPNQI